MPKQKYNYNFEEIGHLQSGSICGKTKKGILTPHEIEKAKGWSHNSLRTYLYKKIDRGEIRKHVKVWYEDLK